MEITGQGAAAAAHADGAETRTRGKRLLDYAFSRLATRNGRLNGNGKPQRVLIVDDDPAIRMLCAVNIEIEGLLVLEAADGRRGLEQARSERPDLVVTDVMMPGLDGFELAEALRSDERTREIPLIFLSSERAPASAERARELGALAFVTKPFDPPALASLVAAELGAVAAANGNAPAAVPAASPLLSEFGQHDQRIPAT